MPGVLNACEKQHLAVATSGPDQVGVYDSWSNVLDASIGAGERLWTCIPLRSQPSTNRSWQEFKDPSCSRRIHQGTAVSMIRSDFRYGDS